MHLSNSYIINSQAARTDPPENIFYNAV